MEKIRFGNRLFYAKFERVDEPLTNILIDQHLKKYYTIALPLYSNTTTKYLYIEYKAQSYLMFIHLIEHILTHIIPMRYYIYRGKKESTIKVFIEVDTIGIAEAEEILSEISSYLEKRLSKEWSMLPDSTLPEEYNIFTLPYVFSRNRRL